MFRRLSSVTSYLVGSGVVETSEQTRATYSIFQVQSLVYFAQK